jgi:hypothetical protein
MLQNCKDNDPNQGQCGAAPFTTDLGESRLNAQALNWPARGLVTVNSKSPLRWFCTECVTELREEMSEARRQAIEPPVEQPEKPVAIKPAEVIQRLWRAADRQIAQSERRMETEADEAVEREARTLSMLGKLVRELTEINLPKRRRVSRKAVQVASADIMTVNGEEMYGDAVDVERFRTALAQGLERLQASRTEEVPGSLQGR